MSGRWLRLILLACTLVGLAAMHTLGHGHTDLHVRHPPMTGAAVVVAPPGPCPDDGCLAAFSGSGHREDGMGGWSVCLAILTAWVVAILLAWALGSAAVGPRTRWRQAAGLMSGRDPPDRIGLRLAAAAVMRT
jgi:hypothetical protein